MSASTQTTTAANPSNSAVNAAAAQSIKANRLHALPPFLFNEIDNKKRAAIAAGKDVINLGVGDPDRPTPAFVIDAMNEAMRQPANHQYPDCWGTARFLNAAAEFMHKRFGVTVDPKKNILATIGGKDGIAHLPLGLLNPGDGAIVCTPAYPVYASASILAGGVVHRVETSPEDHWLPRFDRGPSATALRTAAPMSKLLWLNFPGNPTGATCDEKFYQQALAFASEHALTVASDLAYSEIYLDNNPRSIVSLFSAPGADVKTTRAIEFHSLSKTFNMTGWRIGFAVGHEDVINALRQVKDNYDSGVFNAIQTAGAVALERFEDPALAQMRSEYAKRAKIVVDALSSIGCQASMPRAGIFVWARCPIDSATGQPMNSWRLAEKLIDEAGVVTVPGAGFGQHCTDWFRISLTRQTDRLEEAMRRLASLKY